VLCRFQIARHLAKGKGILELTGLPGCLLPGCPTASDGDIKPERDLSAHPDSNQDEETEAMTGKRPSDAAAAECMPSLQSVAVRKSPRTNATDGP
jgi:hypothetical protein